MMHHNPCVFRKVSIEVVGRGKKALGSPQKGDRAEAPGRREGAERSTEKVATMGHRGSANFPAIKIDEGGGEI